MYIFAINLVNYRSFENIWVFPNPEMNVIVGPNNCGKSTILRALSYVLDPTINYRQPNLLSRFDFYRSNITHPIEIIGVAETSLSHRRTRKSYFTMIVKS